MDVLRHVPTGYTFTFEYDEQMQHHAVLRPGRDAPVERGFPGNWEGQLGYVTAWLTYVHREYEARDPWEGVNLGAPPPEVENTPFTAEEQARIEAHVAGVLDYARKSYELTAEQDATLERLLGEIAADTKRLGRLDWRRIALGAFFEELIEQVIPREIVFRLLGLTFQGLVQLFGGLDIGELPRPRP